MFITKQQETLKQWLSEGVAANPQLQLVAGIIYCNEGNFDEALRCLNQCDLLEAYAFFAVHTLLTTLQ